MASVVRKTYVLGNYRLEPDKRSLDLAGEPVRLANKPFQVLLYLIDNRHRFVSRSELLESFWEGKDVYDVALSKCIGAIRKSLDDRAEAPRFIETRWAEGYRYIGPIEEQLASSDTSLSEVETLRGIKIVVEEEIIRDSEPEFASDIAISSPRKSSAFLGLSSRYPVMALGLILAAIAIIAISTIVYRSRAVSSVVPQSQSTLLHSIAVLPLKNLSGDPKNDYLSDGLTESLISAFSQIKDLKVISRTSAFTFKSKEVDPREVGRALAVEGLLEGSFRLDGQMAHVEVRLVSTTDGRVLWTSPPFERPLANVFDIQDTVACAVGSELKVRLCGEGEATRSNTKNYEAYEDYLRGRSCWHTRKDEAMKEAVEYFERAVKLDPDYALAYAGLADTFAVMEVNSQIARNIGAAKAKEYAAKALALDDTLAGPYAALGLVTSACEWRWQESESYFEKALALNPRYATTHHWYGYSLFAQGEFAEAEKEFNWARELDPLAFGISNTLVQFYYDEKNYEACLKQVEINSKLVPGDRNGPFYSGLIYLETGRLERAIQEFKKTAAGRKEIAVAWAQGRKDEALRGLEKLQKSQMGIDMPTSIAQWYARLGDKESAFVWLEKAFVSHDSELAFIKVDPSFNILRADPRFQDLLRRVHLSQ